MKSTIRIDHSSSFIFEKNVIDWIVNSNEHLSYDEIVHLDNHIKKKYNPMVVTAFLDSEDIQKFNYLTKLQYEYIQGRLIIEREIEPATVNLYPYKLIRIIQSDQLDQLLNISKDMDFDDRFTIDPYIDNSLSLKRIQYFLKLSFERKNEFIFLLLNTTRNSILGFRSFSVNEQKKAKLLLSGTVKSEIKFKLNKFINLLEIEKFDELDIRKVSSVISINNLEEINRYLAELNYKVVKATMVLRKKYPSN